MHVASTDGVRVAMHNLGGVGAPLLLAHATGFHGCVWAPMAHHLGARFHCWALDFRGHGDSGSAGADTVDWAEFGKDAGAAAGALGARRGLAVGHSMGGTALLMVELNRPGTFAGLVLFEPIAGPPDPSRAGPAAIVASPRRRRSVFTSREEAYDNYAAKPPLNVLTPEALRAYVDHGFVDQQDGTVRLKCDPEHEAAIFEVGMQNGTFERLPDVRCPVLVLAGSAEENPPGTLAPLVADALPAGRFLRLPELTHLGPMQDPAAVAAQVLAFADEIDPSLREAAHDP